MKCLSVLQPFAAFIADGDKTIESRTWATKYRGPLLICAGVGWHDGQYVDFAVGEGGKMVFDCVELRKDCFRRGQAIAVVDLVDCRPMTEADERAAMCELYPGAWSWVLENVRAIKPFPFKGQLRLWDFDNTVKIEYL